MAEAPAVEHHLVADDELDVVRCLYRTRQVDAGDQRETLDNRRCVGDRHTVLIVDGRVIDPHRDVSSVEVAVLQHHKCGRNAGVGLAGADGTERHVILLISRSEHPGDRYDRSVPPLAYGVRLTYFND